MAGFMILPSLASHHHEIARSAAEIARLFHAQRLAQDFPAGRAGRVRTTYIGRINGSFVGPPNRVGAARPQVPVCSRRTNQRGQRAIDQSLHSR